MTTIESAKTALRDAGWHLQIKQSGRRSMYRAIDGNGRPATDWCKVEELDEIVRLVKEDEQ